MAGEWRLEAERHRRLVAWHAAGLHRRRTAPGRPHTPSWAAGWAQAVRTPVAGTSWRWPGWTWLRPAGAGSGGGHSPAGWAVPPARGGQRLCDAPMACWQLGRSWAICSQHRRFCGSQSAKSGSANFPESQKDGRWFRTPAQQGPVGAHGRLNAQADAVLGARLTLTRRSLCGQRGRADGEPARCRHYLAASHAHQLRGNPDRGVELGPRCPTPRPCPLLSSLSVLPALEVQPMLLLKSSRSAGEANQLPGASRRKSTRCRTCGCSWGWTLRPALRLERLS